ncbi:MAG TPA: tetratricopeptide repeat protein [Limnochordales bacterium]
MRKLGVVLAAALLVVAWLGRPGQGQTQVDTAAIRLQTALRYMAMGWMAEAREHLQQAVRLAPRHVEARVLLAMSYHADGLLDQALTHYRVAVALDPELAALRVLMGEIYLSLGMLAEAEAEYAAALASDEGAGWAYYGLGRVRQARGDGDAEEMYQAAVTHAPDLLDARLRLGRLLRDRGQAEEALAHLLHAQRLDSRLPAVRLELGLTYELLGRIAEAEHEYRMVLQMDPANVEARHRLGMLEAAQGDT